MSDDKERIAALEKTAEYQQQLLEEMRDDLKQLLADWTKARGMAAGAVLAVSAIWGVVLAGWQFVKAKVGG